MIQSVRRALSLLEILDHAGPGGLGLTEIAREAGLKLPTTHHLLLTLINREYVTQDSVSRHYALGSRAVSLGRSRSLTDRLSEFAAAAIEALHGQVNETIVLALYANGLRHTIECRESDHALRVGAAKGADSHLYGTATGRVLLSLLSATELKRFVSHAGFPGEDWPGIDSLSSLEAVLSGIRERGCAEYRRPGSHVQALAVPVNLTEGLPRVAIGLYFPTVRDSVERRCELSGALRRAASSIGAELERI